MNGVTLPKAYEPIRLRQTEHRKLEEQHLFADQRTRFEQAVFQLMSYVESQGLVRPECFISYAWGDQAQERWVERNLATDLHKAGISVLLDKWENTRIGARVLRFIERIEGCDKIIVVGTPAYRKKYANKETEQGFVVATEGDLMAPRILGTEAERESVLPVLLAGEAKESLPLWLQGRVYADFRNDRAYFTTAFELILSLYQIAPNNTAVAHLRDSLRETELRNEQEHSDKEREPLKHEPLQKDSQLELHKERHSLKRPGQRLNHAFIIALIGIGIFIAVWLKQAPEVDLVNTTSLHVGPQEQTENALSDLHTKVHESAPPLTPAPVQIPKIQNRRDQSTMKAKEETLRAIIDLHAPSPDIQHLANRETTRKAKEKLGAIINLHAPLPDIQHLANRETSVNQ